MFEKPYFNKFEIDETKIWADSKEQYKDQPRLRFWTNIQPTLLDVTAFELCVALNEKCGVVTPIAISGPSLQVIVAVKEQDFAGREMARQFLETGMFNQIAYEFGINKVALENFPDPKRNGIYKPQSGWTKVPAAK